MQIFQAGWRQSSKSKNQLPTHGAWQYSIAQASSPTLSTLQSLAIHRNDIIDSLPWDTPTRIKEHDSYSENLPNKSTLSKALNHGHKMLSPEGAARNQSSKKVLISRGDTTTSGTRSSRGQMFGTLAMPNQGEGRLRKDLAQTIATMA
eukprot:552768-Amphidinium_carterae.1